MDKWEMICANDSDIRRFLNNGWEPFAVTCEPNVAMGATTFQHTVWLRRKIKEVTNEN